MKINELPEDLRQDLARVKIELEATMDFQVEGDSDFSLEEGLLAKLDDPESDYEMSDFCDMYNFYYYTVGRAHEVPALDIFTTEKE